jgi:hypothetical protein
MGTHIMTRTYASPSLGAAIVQETPLKKIRTRVRRISRARSTRRRYKIRYGSCNLEPLNSEIVHTQP